MRYNKFNKRNFHKKDKYPRDEGMTVTVRQIKDKAINKLRSANRSKLLKTYLGM